MDFRGMNRALHQPAKGSSYRGEATLPDWIVVGRSLKYLSQSQRGQHVVNVEKIEDARRAVIIRFEEDQKVWKRIPFTEINAFGDGILQPMWKKDKAILTVPEKPAGFVEPQLDDSQKEEAVRAKAGVEEPQLPPPDGRKSDQDEEAPKELEAHSEAGNTHPLQAQPEEEPEARGGVPDSIDEAEERENEASVDDGIVSDLEENACTDPYTTCTDPYLDLGESCETAEVYADPYLESAALEQEPFQESSVVAEEQALTTSKPSSKDVKAKKRKAAKELDAQLSEAASPNMERPVVSDVDKSLSTARRDSKYEQVQSLLASIETEKPEVLAPKRLKVSKRKADASKDFAKVTEDVAAEPAATTDDGNIEHRGRGSQAGVQADLQTASTSKDSDKKGEACVETVRVPAASAKRKAKDAKKAINDEPPASSKDEKDAKQLVEKKDRGANGSKKISRTLQKKATERTGKGSGGGAKCADDRQSNYSDYSDCEDDRFDGRSARRQGNRRVRSRSRGARQTGRQRRIVRGSRRDENCERCRSRRRQQCQTRVRSPRRRERERSDSRYSYYSSYSESYSEAPGTPHRGVRRHGKRRIH